MHEVEPTVSVNLAPTWGNTRKIPNEDSSDFEFDETNLFEPDRFAGLDRIDTGSRVAYGLRFSSYGPRATEFSGVFGQSYSFTENEYIPPEFGRAGQSLGLCRRVLCAPQPAARPLLPLPPGQERPEVPPQDALASFGPSFLRFNVGYVNLSREPEAFDDERDVRRRTRSGSNRARRSRWACASSSPTRSPSAARPAATSAPTRPSPIRRV